MTAYRILEPGRFDFGIISVNDEEDDAIRTMFGFPNYKGKYRWGIFETAGGCQISVAYGSTYDFKGPGPARRLMDGLINAFEPQYILVLGTAGGVREKGITHGQVVYSRLVYTTDNRGHGKSGIEFELDPAMPPDEQLLHLATRVAKQWDGLHATYRKLKAPNGPRARTIPRPRAVEIFSGPDRHDDASSRLLREARKQFPKVAAFEMESGGVATGILSHVREGRCSGYLVIKGITDLVDDSADLEERKRKRREWAPYASAASATMAASLLRAWERGNRPIADGRSILPREYQAILETLQGAFCNRKCVMLHRVHDTGYSDVSRLYSELPSTRYAFTVCTYEPSYFMARVAHKCLGDASKKKVFLRAADVLFPHFAALRELNDKSGCKVVRVVVAKGPLGKWWAGNAEALQSFVWLNGKIQCYVVSADALKEAHVPHLGDHVTFNSEVCLDYDEDSETLAVTYYAEEDELRSEFEGVSLHLERNAAATKVYVPLEELVQSGEAAVKLRA